MRNAEAGREFRLYRQPSPIELWCSIPSPFQHVGRVRPCFPRNFYTAQHPGDLLQFLAVPVLGLVENMSYFIAPDTGNRYDIFGTGGAEKAAERLEIPFLGPVPLVMSIREGSDAGTPPLVAAPDGAEAKVYRLIAHRLVASIS